MKNRIISLGFFIAISFACIAQPAKQEQEKKHEQVEKKSIDSVIFLSPWHQQQIVNYDAEIKRLGGTTIEAEQQRLYNEKQILINSFLTAKIPDISRVEKINPPEGNKMVVTLKPKK